MASTVARRSPISPWEPSVWANTWATKNTSSELTLTMTTSPMWE